MTSTSLFERQTTDGQFGELERSSAFRHRMTLAIEGMEKAGWAVRQIVQVQDDHAFFVVFEREGT